MKDILRVPVEVTYRIVDGEPVKVRAEYAEISADAFARFLIQKFGKTPIFKGEEEE